MHADDILAFWFKEITPRQQFKKDAAFDALCRQRFEPVYWQALAGELALWRWTPDGDIDAAGRLAEIIILDQLGRNIFRDTAQAFAGDPLALALAQELVQAPAFADLPVDHRNFALMPMMHSESALVQERAIPLFERWADAETLKFAHLHKQVIDRFGRFPHRNEALGRTSSAEETAYIASSSDF